MVVDAGSPGSRTFGDAYLNRLRALISRLRLELHPLTLFERSVPSHLDLRVMDEQIWRSIVGDDEPVTLFGVEPLDDTGSHDAHLSDSRKRRQPESIKAQQEP